MAENKPILGELLTGGEQRDAIHIAILPVTAGDCIAPGARVYVNQEGYASISHGSPNAIADPFLKYQLYPGQRFYALIFPYTIESLRHEWVHPDFPKTLRELATTDEQKASLRWLEEFASENYSEFKWIMEQTEAVVNGEQDYITFGTEMYGKDMSEFWHHYEVYTGKRISTEVKADTFFGCSC